jgi:hypothetical protein
MCALTFWPIFCFYIIRRFRDRLDEESTKTKIGFLYLDVKTHGKKMHKLNYYTIFLCRRLFFVFVPTFIYMYDYIQLQMLMFSTSLYIISYSGSKPHISKRRTQLESFNEFMIMIATYHLVCFSRFNLDMDMQF